VPVIRNPLEAPPAGPAAVVVHTPTGRDGALVAELLSSHGHVVRRAATNLELARQMDEAVGAVVLAEEALQEEAARLLLEHLAAQPSWSDLPVIILTTPARGPRAPNGRLAEFLERSNATLLERPVQPVTLLSAVHAALRARARQHQVRRYLEERALAEEQERRRQRIEAVGTLAGGVAHEVNNMLAVMLGFSDMVLRQLSPGTPAAADLQEVIRAGQRAARITQQLLAFSRQQPNQPVVLSLAAVVRELLKLLHQTLGPEYQLVLDLPAELPHVRADRTQVEQVLINLVLNARDATPPGGTISIAAEAVELDADYGRRHPDLEIRQGPYVMVSVTDTGEGMDDATLERAFEPFFTTKGVGHGTGLGLSTVYGIVKQAAGYVWIYTEPGQGTSIKVYLPAVLAPERAADHTRDAGLRGRERILVVEDEEMVRRMARRALEEYGYRTLEAADGSVALELLSRGDHPVDLVLCDIVMPGLGGPALGAALAELRPEVPIIYMSGYPRQDVARRQLVPAGMPFVQKPFRAEDLAAKVRATLDRGAAGAAAERGV
jgi:signal transduction histidine kinase/ActR/RegA family two-component response regulator